MQCLLHKVCGGKTVFQLDLGTSQWGLRVSILLSFLGFSSNPHLSPEAGVQRVSRKRDLAQLRPSRASWVMFGKCGTWVLFNSDYTWKRGKGALFLSSVFCSIAFNYWFCVNTMVFWIPRYSVFWSQVVMPLALFFLFKIVLLRICFFFMVLCDF